MRSPSARFMPSTPGALAVLPARTRSTGGASTLSVAAAGSFAHDAIGAAERTTVAVRIALARVRARNIMTALLDVGDTMRRTQPDALCDTLRHEASAAPANAASQTAAEHSMVRARVAPSAGKSP